MFESVTFTVATRPRFLNLAERKRRAARHCVNTKAVVIMTEEQASATTYAISLKLLDFWPSDPELWFAQVEASFKAQKITHEVRPCCSRSTSTICLRGRDIILRPPEKPYKAIMEELQKRDCMLRRQQLQQLLHTENLDDRKPSQLLLL